MKTVEVRHTHPGGPCPFCAAVRRLGADSNQQVNFCARMWNSVRQIGPGPYDVTLKVIQNA